MQDNFSKGLARELSLRLQNRGITAEDFGAVLTSDELRDDLVDTFIRHRHENQPVVILEREREAHQRFFGQEFDLTKFEIVLKKYGSGIVHRWRNLSLEPHFLPAIVMSQDAEFPGWKIKPGNNYYQLVAEGKILRRQDNGRLVVDREAFQLEGITVLIDTRLKPRYFKTSKGDMQMFENDNLLGPIIRDLRKARKIKAALYNPAIIEATVSTCICQNSRFYVSAKEWRDHIRTALAERLKVEVSQVRLERAIETNVISQLYPHMPRYQEGKTNTFLWYEEYFENGGMSCHSGDGLSDFYHRWTDGHWECVAFRPLVVL